MILNKRMATYDAGIFECMIEHRISLKSRREEVFWPGKRGHIRRHDEREPNQSREIAIERKRTGRTAQQQTEKDVVGENEQQPKSGKIASISVPVRLFFLFSSLRTCQGKLLKVNPEMRSDFIRKERPGERLKGKFVVQVVS